MRYDPKLIFSLISKVRGKANRFLLEELKRNGLEGLSPVHGDILYTLFTNGPLTMKLLAEKIDRNKSTLTTLVEKLIDLDFVEKRPVAGDQRSYEIWLTEKGYGLRDSLLGISDRLIQKGFQNVSPREQKELMRLLAKLAANL